MFSTMNDILQFFENRSLQLGMNFGLSRMEQLLDRLDNPHKKLKYIHIAGSNGKGSTLYYIKEMLITEGYTIASFTSPYLEQINEQLQINHKPISDEEFVSTFQRIFPVVQEMDQIGSAPTQFEMLTAMAFCYFQNHPVDLVLLETGLGGRLDSTNVIEPLLSIITTISLEHTNILGNTLAEIASEKAGIIKAGAPVISGVLEEEPAKVIEEKAMSLHASYFQLSRNIITRDITLHDSTQSFTFMMGDTVLENLHLQMLGHHQIHNAALAVAAVILLKNHYSISESSIRKGLLKAKWKGRFEKLSDNPTVIIDGAHNDAGIKVLLETLQTQYPNHTYRFVFSALRDKNYPHMFQMLSKAAKEIMITEFNHERAASADDLFKHCVHENKQMEKNWKKAICEVLQHTKADEVMVVTGSLYFLILARDYLLQSCSTK